MKLNSELVANLKKGVVSVIKKAAGNPYSKAGLSRLDVKKLKHYPVGFRRHKFLGGEIEFFDPREFLYGTAEIFVHEIYNQQLNKDAFVIDCGANIGLSVIYLKKICPSASIIAFEPDNKNYELLKTNLQLQGINGVDIRKEAVWIEDCELSFSGGGTMSSKIADSDVASTTKVKAVRLKDLLNRRVDFLKIDIEGAEYRVLEDIRDNLHYVNNMFLEYHGLFSNQNELTRIFQCLTEAGFRYYIEQAADIFPKPFYREVRNSDQYDIQLNIFCFRV